MQYGSFDCTFHGAAKNALKQTRYSVITLSKYSIYLMSVCRSYVVIFSAKVRARHDEVHMEVSVIILEYYELHRLNNFLQQ